VPVVADVEVSGSAVVGRVEDGKEGSSFGGFGDMGVLWRMCLLCVKQYHMTLRGPAGNAPR
jgi:hypothetical protein